MNKIHDAVDNLINGNLSDYKKQVKNFKKFEIVKLILFVEDTFSDTIYHKEFKKKLIEILRD